ncbi:MAG: hypothetical protein RR550_04005, partial [Rikenellaceae bacterium]
SYGGFRCRAIFHLLPSFLSNAAELLKTQCRAVSDAIEREGNKFLNPTLPLIDCSFLFYK